MRIPRLDRGLFLFVGWMWFAGSLAATPATWAPSLTTRALWNSNATNSDRSSDIIGALQLDADLGAVRRLSLARNDALWMGARLAVATTPRFNELDRVTLGSRLEWRHKFGLGAFAPVLGFELAAEAAVAREADRAGLGGSSVLSWRQRLNPGTRLSLTYERARYHARAGLFDRTGEETTGELAHDFNERWRLTGTLRLRHGTVLSYAMPPRPDLVPLAKERKTVTTFGPPRVAYSLDAQSLGGGLAVARTLGKTATLVFDYHCRQTNQQALRYVNHLVSATLARQF